MTVVWSANYLVVNGRARVTVGDAPELLGRLAKVYLGSGVTFPPMPDPPPGLRRAHRRG